MTKPTPTPKKAPAPMPAAGGSWIRKADGSLRRISPVPAAPETTPAPKKD